MKKTLTVMALLAGAVSVYSQGAVGMNDYFTGFFGVQVEPAQGSGVGTQVTVGGQTGWEVIGNSANTYQVSAYRGATLYSGSTGLAAGAYDVGLLGVYGTATSYDQLSLAAGSVIPGSQFLSVTGTTSSAGLGNNLGAWSTANVATVAGGGASTGGGSGYTIALAAWQNSGSKGAATTLAQAEADGYAWGVSGMVSTTLATGGTPPGGLPFGAGGLTDFSLASTTVPEPSTIALGVIGASTLLFRRRK